MPDHNTLGLASHCPTDNRDNAQALRSFPWPGGKAMHLKWLLPLLPECNHYVEPFGGSAVALLNRPNSPIETYNDLDGEVVNFFGIVRDQPDELKRLIDLTPYSRAEFAASLGPSEHLSDLERARRFYVRVRQSYQGFSVNALPYNWGTTPNESRNGMSLASARFRSGATRFNDLASRLSGVLMDSRPAMSVIAALDAPDRLFYCDPPYVAETWKRKDKTYTNILTDDDHRDLASALNECRAKVAISGYDSVLYSDLYPAAKWRKIIAPPQRSHASKRYRQEVLWCNYGDDGKRLRHTMVAGAVLENPTPANTQVNVLVSQVALAAIDAWKAKGRQHKALHAFMGRTYSLASKLSDDESEFNRIMQARGIKKPKLDHLYYHLIQAFQPEEQRADPDMKSEASRLKRAFIQAEALGYTPGDFVRRIERKEVVAGRRISGVNKLIKLARLSKPLKRVDFTSEAAGLPGMALPDRGASFIDLSGYLATMLNKAIPHGERLTAMDAAADAAERAGVSPDQIEFHLSVIPGRVTIAPAALTGRPEPWRSRPKARRSKGLATASTI
ncbi:MULTISPECIES: DNA adenine methylase [unclassified Tardiphaga]|uniref:DNA adenine methylase n=1 Tax=unclassified Tardiphaga TaxID=2631404 RepID=UPI00210FE077|nr:MULTISPECIES: DNA adenine methylase [unclassified Tardiphaga]